MLQWPRSCYPLVIFVFFHQLALALRPRRIEAAAFEESSVADDANYSTAATKESKLPGVETLKNNPRNVSSAAYLLGGDIYVTPYEEPGSAIGENATFSGQGHLHRPLGWPSRRDRFVDAAVPAPHYVGTWERDDVQDLAWRDILIALGDGSGFYSDRTLRARTILRYQHLAASLLIILIFCGFLCISLSMVHWQVQAQVHQLGSVKYFAHFGSELASVDGQELPNFLETFDKPLSEASLVVSGWEPHEDAEFDEWLYDHRYLRWHGQIYKLAFSFALDISPWLEPTCLPDGDSSDDELAAIARLQQQGSSSPYGLSADDQLRLRSYLRANHNSLSRVEIQKEIIFPGWEELATNIRAYLRQKGFSGMVQVSCQGSESVTIHKNNAWAHFMRSRATRVIAALSIFGWVFYEVYMYIRDSKLVVRSKHHVDVPINQFWGLVGENLTAQGFNPSGDDAASPGSMTGAAPAVAATRTPMPWRLASSRRTSSSMQADRYW
jgi:hypothetical protein